MYKNVFSKKSEGSVSYGTAQDKIGEDFADAVFGGIGPFFGGVIDGVGDTFGNVADYAQNALSGAGDDVMQYFGDAYDSAGDFFEDSLGRIGDINFGERLNGFAHSSWNSINHGFDEVLREIRKGF